MSTGVTDDLAFWKKTCVRERDGDQYWICHRCGSCWSDMLAGTGWFPLSCPNRQRADYAPQPGQFDAAARRALSRATGARNE